MILDESLKINAYKFTMNYTCFTVSAFPQSFFDEIEDLKYSLHRSTKLNKYYEKTLQNMCFEYGIPFPRLNY